MATIRFSSSNKPSASFARALQPVSDRQGLSGAHVLESQPMAGMRQTTEQKIRGGDAAANDLAAALSAPAVAFYRLSYTLSAKEAARG